MNDDKGIHVGTSKDRKWIFIGADPSLFVSSQSPLKNQKILALPFNAEDCKWIIEQLQEELDEQTKGTL